jgi:DNA-binding MarR family transcriptional regulator
MNANQKAELVGEFCRSIAELRFRLKRMFQLKLKEAGIDISFEVLEVMSILLKQDGTNQQVLADLLFKDKSSMTYLIDNMVKTGLVIRKEDERDRRNKLISLTTKAHELKTKLAPLAIDCYAKLGSEIGETDLKNGLQMLVTMNSSVEDLIV